MDVQELTSCILQFSTATIFDEIKFQSSVLGQSPPAQSPTSKVTFGYFGQARLVKLKPVWGALDRVKNVQLSLALMSVAKFRGYFGSAKMGLVGRSFII